MPSGWLSRSATLGLIALLFCLLVIPVGVVVYSGFVEEGELTIVWFTDILEDSFYRTGLINSLIKGAAVTILAQIIALPLALISDRFDFKGRGLLVSLVLVPLILPPFVGAAGLQGMLSRNGGINSLLVQLGLINANDPIDWLANPFLSCIVLEALYLYPISFLNTQAALANIDNSLFDAAEDLGSGPWRRLFRVTLPLARHGLFAGSALIFIWSCTELGTPLMVGFNDLTVVHVFSQLQTTNPQGDAYALVTLLLIICALVYAIGKWALGRPVPVAPSTSIPVKRVLKGKTALLAALPFMFVFALAVLPHTGVLLGSISGTGRISLSPDNVTAQHYIQLWVDFGSSDHFSASRSIANSFKYSILAMTVDAFLGISIAYLVVRRYSRLTASLDFLAMLPLAVPGLIVAFGYFAITQGEGFLSFLNPLENDPTPLLVIAYSVRRLPFLVRACAAGLQQISETLEEAAMDLGATRVRTLSQIVIPLLAANLFAGGILVFSRSMLEVSDSLILSFDKKTYPLTKAIWELSSIPESGLETACALGTVGMALLGVTMITASLLLGKKFGSVFRL
ncbi:MAG: ABC transporter permease [Planctomycetota bacterium]|jgi:iron(III) transport system permease protein